MKPCLWHLVTLLLCTVLTATAEVRYVNVSNLDPSPPYITWHTAATSIQDAVDVAVAGDQILVTNGVYNGGGRVVYGSMSNRVAITKPVTVQSVNGPELTIIEGYQIPGTTNGDAAIRCAYLTNGAALVGFTLTNGATRSSGDYDRELVGGGLWCESSSAVVSNCLITGNSAYEYGGGAYSGTLVKCTITFNSATEGGGACLCNMTNCTLTRNRASWSGGGTRSGSLTNCTVAYNSASSYAGGVSGATVVGSTLIGNSASYAGGASAGLLIHCTIASNSVSGQGGGSHYSSLSDCILMANSAGDGGGAYSGTLSNCTFIGNSATNQGGGAYSSTLMNCALCQNTAVSGGGINNCDAYNCTLTGNSAISGGGSYFGRLNNCIIYFNYAPINPNFYNGTLNYCCTMPLPPSGVGNLAADPKLASPSHLSFDSPCRGAGQASYAKGLDIDGEPWANPPAIGCDEFYSGASTGAQNLAVQVSYTNVAVGFTVDFTAKITGYPSGSFWDFGDGTVVSNKPYASHAWSASGDYTVTAGVYGGGSPQPTTATIVVRVVPQPVQYVDLVNESPTAPYTNWATAANNIQDAVDATTTVGALVLVNDGTYATGGRVVFGAMSNRVAITKPVTVQSVHGPEVTRIQGYQVPLGVQGDSAIRCAFVTNRAALIGFTLTNGASRYSGDYDQEQSGAGVWCASPGALVSNCIIISNAARWAGGAFGGSLSGCTLIGNSGPMSGGGAYFAILTNSVLTGNSSSGGGGAGYSSLFNCTLANNTSSGYGGGAMSCWLVGCLLTSNSAPGYGSGGAVYSGTLSNCTLLGNTAKNSGGGASYATLTHCAMLTNSASSGGGASACTLDNCLLTGNTAGSGGAISSGSGNNCTLTGNSATSSGGGGYSANLVSCALTGNWAPEGGGVESGTLSNCTLTGNSASYGGGAYYSTLKNCILYFNRASLDPAGANYSGGALSNCCTTPLPTGGAGNITADPQLANFSHLSAGSPCRGAGSETFASGLDIDGDLWANPPSIGCDEFYPGSALGELSVSIQAAYTNVALGFTVDFVGSINGNVSASVWDFGDGSFTSNRPYASHAWASAGDYTVTLRAYNDTSPAGVVSSSLVHVAAQPVHFVALASTSPAPPYTNWVSAATNIQDAVDAAEAGATVLVGGGVYALGGRVVYGSMSNRVAVTKPITIQSVNGPAATVIQGYQMPGVTNGDNAIRCVYLGDGAMLVGFTLTNGATRAAGDIDQEESGGGVWTGLGGVVSNCLFRGNAAYNSGGAAYYGTLNNCVLGGNQAMLGGGAYRSTLFNCLLTNNVAGAYGGGVYYGALANCTIVANSAYRGGGVSSATLNNCILYYNNARTGSNYDYAAFNCCCTMPLPPLSTGSGNFANEPLFIDQAAGNLHLQPSSPCINSGLNAFVLSMTDLDGNQRISGGTVDVGAYEFPTPLSIISYAWLQHYGMPLDGSADGADPDGDGLVNWQEWIAGTDPTNSASTLRMLPPTNTPNGLILSWTSVTNQTYSLERATDLSGPRAFSLLQTNLPGRNGVTTYTDTNSLGLQPVFYRVRVTR